MKWLWVVTIFSLIYVSSGKLLQGVLELAGELSTSWCWCKTKVLALLDREDMTNRSAGHSTKKRNVLGPVVLGPLGTRGLVAHTATSCE